jgi:cytochrome c-type biogenesis protein CcmF
VFNNMLLTLGAATVLLGTLYPLLLEAVTSGESRVSVGPPFFNATFVPIMVPLLLAVAAGPFLAWKRGDLGVLAYKLVPSAVAAVITIALTFVLAPDGPVLAPFGLGLAAWLGVGALAELAWRIRLFDAAGESWRRLKGLPRSALGMTLAHFGLAVMIVGITGSSAWRLEMIGTLGIGETHSEGAWAVTLDAVNDGEGPNYSFQSATLSIRHNGDLAAVLTPERRYFPVANQSTTEAGIQTSWRADLYGVIGEPASAPGVQAATNAWTVRFYVNPLVPWIWAGTLLMVAGGSLSLSDRRHRVGAPRRAAPLATPAAATGGAPVAAE